MKDFRKTIKIFSLVLISVILLYISGVVAYTYTTTRNISVSLRVVSEQEETTGYPLFLVAGGVSISVLVVIALLIYGKKLRGR